MKSWPDEKIGDVTIRIVSQSGRYLGVLIRDKRMSDRYEDADLATLRVRLRNEAGKLHPDYVGMDGAIARFLRFFPAGFSDPAFLHDERAYKVAAQERLKNVLPLIRATDATPEQAVAVRRAFNTNILHSTELAGAHELLGGANGPAYVRAAARFAHGELDQGLAGMVAAVQQHGRPSWPLLTYLPSLWLPEEHMFLKPSATCDFAQRIGTCFSTSIQRFLTPRYTGPC